MSKIVFIGNLQWGRVSNAGGVQTKNQLFLKYILSRTKDVRFYDTFNKIPLVSFITSIVYILFAGKTTPVILSVSIKGPYWIAKTFRFFHINRRVFYWVAGGDLAITLKGYPPHKLVVYDFYEKVVVQCEYLKRDLEALGLKNCTVVTNFKPVIFEPSVDKHDNATPRLVYFSRILKEKGIDEIVEVVKSLYRKNISIDFYGTLCPPYTKEYFDRLNSYNIRYLGFLDVSKPEGYETLSQYDALIFPTHYVGEGFPGTLLDSFIAGVPVIASDFHANGEVINDGYNGLLIPPLNVEQLSKAIIRISSDVELRRKLRINAIHSASKYDAKTVLDEAFEKLGITIR